MATVSSPPWEREPDVFVGDLGLPHADRPESRQASGDLVDQVGRGRGPGRDTDPAGARKPLQVDLAGVVDQMGGYAFPRGNLDQAQRVGRVARAHDEDEVAVSRDGPD